MQKNIYGCTDYILAGAKTDCAAGRLNCYFFIVFNFFIFFDYHFSEYFHPLTFHFLYQY